MTNVKDSYNEEQNYPISLSKLLNDSINLESNYHYLGLLSLNTVISNLNVCLYLLELLNFQVTYSYVLKFNFFSYVCDVNLL